MTPERRREIEAMIALGYGEPWRSAVVDLLDEVRRLPVIPTCSECRHVWGEGSAGETCTHPEANSGSVRAKGAPPPWCPFRGMNSEAGGR